MEVDAGVDGVVGPEDNSGVDAADVAGVVEVAAGVVEVVAGVLEVVAGVEPLDAGVVEVDAGMVEVVAGVELLVVGVEEVDADAVELVAAVELLVAEAELLEGVEGVEELVERMVVVGVVEEEEEGWEELEAGEEEPAPLLEMLSLCARKTNRRVCVTMQCPGRQDRLLYGFRLTLFHGTCTLIGPMTQRA